MSCFYISPNSAIVEGGHAMTLPKRWEISKAEQAELEQIKKNHRQKVARWAKKEIEKGCLILDTETNGTGPDAEAVQISVVDGKTGETLFNKLVKPIKPVPPEASAVNHITNEMLETAPEFKDVWEELQGLLKNRSIIAYNAEFDRRILNQTVTENKVEVKEKLNTTWTCLMKAYCHYSLNERWQKLVAVCEAEDILVANAHDAVGDCVMTQKLLAKLASEAEDDEIPAPVDLAATSPEVTASA